MSKFLNKIEEAEQTLYEIAIEIQLLSKSFAHIGNNKVADNLLYYAKGILNVKKTINNAICEDLNSKNKKHDEFMKKITENLIPAQ